MAASDDILRFWFGDAAGNVPVAPERHRLWFGGDERTDEEIRQHFGGAVERALAGGSGEWAATSQGRLALILLLDQFTRNIYRQSPEAYAGDARALELCRQGRRQGQDLALTIPQRAFFYLPLEHAEDLPLQRESVAAFTALLAEAPPELQETCRGFLDYAIRHHDIIARFGRFPHRNAVLGRASTPGESEFLKQPGSSF